MAFCAYCFLHCSSFSGHIKEQISVGTVPEKRPFEPSIPITSHSHKDYGATHNHHFNSVPANVRVQFFKDTHSYMSTFSNLYLV